MDDRPTTTGHKRSPMARQRARHDVDLYSWAVEQTALLRAGRIDEADVANIAEKLDDVGKELYFRLESALRVILLQLIKWDHQPLQRSRSWRAGIGVQRNHVRRILQKNPGLKSRVGEATKAAYADARILASSETRLALAEFPDRCPYTWANLMDRPIEWPPKD